MSTGRRALAVALLGMTAVAFLAIGTLWLRDRTARWETPRLDPTRFVVMRSDGPRIARTRVVAVNLRCPSCLGLLRRLELQPSDPGRIVLIVDHPARPTPFALRSVRSGNVWWDRHGVWRRRWGHRVYGEILRFDRDGRYLGTIAPADQREPVLSEHGFQAPARRR